MNCESESKHRILNSAQLTARAAVTG